MEREPPVPPPFGSASEVALHDPDLVVVEAERAGHELRIGGPVPLPRRLGADMHADRAVRFQHRLGRLGTLEGADLDVGAEAEPTDSALRTAFGKARLEAVRLGARERLVHVGGELARVVDVSHHGLVGHLLGPDEIPPADLRWRKPGDARRLVHQPLDEEGRLRASGAAIGVGRNGVGEDALADRVDSAGCRRRRSS